MTSRRLVLRSLAFYWRTHLGVAAGVAVATAVLVGALVVGDCVRYSLRAIALSRLGAVELALVTGDRLFRAALADDLRASLHCPVAPVLQLSGVAVSPDGDTRANRVQVLGMDERFWQLASAATDSPATEPGSVAALGTASWAAPARAGRSARNDTQPAQEPAVPDGVVLNDELAARLNVRPGDSVLLRIGKPSLLPLDAPLSSTEDTTAALRLTVERIVPRSEFGHFSLRADQLTPLNAFVDIRTLQQRAGLAGRANLLLVGQRTGEAVTVQQAGQALEARWQLADADLELRDLPGRDVLELRTGRVFIDPAVAAIAQDAAPGAASLLVYFVNEIRLGDRATPYSLMAAGRPWSALSQTQPSSLPAGVSDLADDEMLVNAWLQEDLGAAAGDELTVRYFVMGEGRTLVEKTHGFRVRGVVPIAGWAADPELMPDYPGFADAENCRDWEPGIPIDLDRIRDKDEQYWDAHRGTPKAFINLATGQRLWGNRFGRLTAIRYPSTPTARERIESAIRTRLQPASVGLVFQPVRARALAAGDEGLDFGQLFVGFSFFLIGAALLLTGLLFTLSVEQRAEEIGTLLAVGFRPRGVRRLLLIEGGVLALAGACLGTALGTLYTRAVLYGMSTIWRGAAGISGLQYHAEPSTLAIGFAGSVLVALATLALAARRSARQPPALLLTGATTWGTGISPVLRGTGLSPVRGVRAACSPRPMPASRVFAAARRSARLGWWLALLALAAATVILVLNGARRDASAAGAFFAAGGLLLFGGMGMVHALLSGRKKETPPERMTLMALGWRNVRRRRSRSLATVGMLACGSFLVVAIGANRHGPEASPQERSSGTGGFTLLGEATLPIAHDLNTPDGREAYGLSDRDLEGVSVVGLRVREGDDASCLNPQRAQTPRLLGMKPEALRSRGAFTFVRTAPGVETADGWSVLGSAAAAAGDVVPAVGDEATVTWGLGRKLGDLIPFTDEQGRRFSIRIAGILANSVLQGNLLISEDDFVARFPSESGYRMLLIDAPADRAAAVSQALSRALQDRGLDLTPTPQRLAAFTVVENTYLSIFQLLGGLGLLLGCGGLGMVVLRNVLERRSELAILRAVGFSRRALHWFLLSEHWLLLLAGLAWGTAAGLAAVFPALRSPAVNVPALSLALTVFAVAASGAVWTWLATVIALRGRLLSALWNE